MLAALLVVSAGVPRLACAQGGGGFPATPPTMFGSKKDQRQVAGPSLSATDEPVAEIRIIGNRTISETQIKNQLETRVGRPFDPALVQRDVRTLARRGWFIDVQPAYEQTAEGRVVIFKVVEAPVIRYVYYHGNDPIHGIRTKKLEKETDLKVGGPVDPYAVEEARRRMLDLYRRNGFNEAQIIILEGNKPTDQGVVFLIHEGPKQKVWNVEFVGNEFVSGRRLKTQIESKRPMLMLYKGFLDREQIDSDVNRLTAYYRAFGFFQAKIGRQLIFNDQGNWVTLRFVIHEGPRYDVESVAFIGNRLFSSESLAQGIELPAGKPFEQSKMNADLEWLKEAYGSQGYIFADIRAEPIFLEEPGKLRLLYKIEEGRRWRIGNIKVHITGDNPHTKIQTALNRLSFRSGEIADIREIRASERRLRASGLFLHDPIRGVTPKITYNIKDLPDSEFASSAPGFRGQSPDDIKPRPSVAEDPPVAENGPPLIAPPGTTATHAPTLQTFVLQPPPGFTPSDEDIEVHLYFDDGVEQGAGSGEPPAPAPHVVHRPPYDEPPPASPYGRLTIRTQSPYQQATTQSTADRYAAAGYGGQAVGATGPDAAPPANNSYPPQQPTSDSRQPTAPSGVTQAQHTTPVFGPPPMMPPPPQYGPPPPGAVVPGTPVLAPDPNITPVTPFPMNPAGAPYPVDPFTPLITDPAVDLDVVLAENQTGRLMLGVAVNSDAGLMGQFSLDERNFDWRRPPQSWDDFLSARAWRGGGQHLRIEAAPGTRVQRYLVSWAEPYWMDTPVSLSLSGSFFDRRYIDWDEQRIGGRVGIGYQWIENDLSAVVSYRGENINIRNISVPGIPELDEVLGDNALHGFRLTVTNDTRDSPFLATQGYFLQAELEQVVGSFVYPRAVLDARQYFLLAERPDRSGRQVLTVGSRVGFTGSDTPVYERFFAGGFSTLRGFAFRGVSPVRQPGNVRVGGDFSWINTVEYLFPITADDMIHGVAFVDFGTVEERVEIRDFRVAPGFGLRVTIPAMGPAPIALDFGLPVLRADFDDRQMFSFSIGLQR